MTAAVLILSLALQDPAPRALVEKLRSENAAERDEAARKLKAIGRPAVRELEEAARDRDVEVSARARHLIRVIGVAEKLTPALKTGFPGIEERLVTEDDTWTAEFLKVADAASTRPELGAADLEALIGPALLHARDPQRLHLIEAVEQWSLGSAAPALKDCLLDATRPGDNEAGKVLARLGPRALGPAVLEILRGKNERARLWVIPILRSIGSPDAVPDLLKSVQSSQRFVRQEAIRTLGDWGRTEAVPVLLKQLGGNDEADIVEALGRIGDPQSIPAVVSALKGPFPGTRRRGYDAIVWLNARDAVPVVLEHLSAPKNNYQSEGLRALRYLSPDDARRQADLLFEAAAPEKRREGVAQLGRLGAREKIGAIAGLLDHDDAGLRSAAMSALVRLDARDQVDRIAARLVVPADAIQAARAMADLGAPANFDTARLLPILHSPDPWTSYGAIEVLGKLGAKDRLPDLLPFLKSSHHFLRYVAATAVGRIAGKESLEPLRPLLRDSNCAVRYYAGQALVRAGLVEGAVTLLKETRDRRNPHQFGDLTTSDTRTCRILNSLRRPADWTKVESTRLPPLTPGSRREHVEAIARELGLKVEWPEGPLHAWFTARAAYELFEPPVTTLDGLIHLLQGSRILMEPPLFELVLEADRIRVVHYLDAIRFWEGWLQERR